MGLKFLASLLLTLAASGGFLCITSPQNFFCLFHVLIPNRYCIHQCLSIRFIFDSCLKNFVVCKPFECCTFTSINFDLGHLKFVIIYNSRPNFLGGNNILSPPPQVIRFLTLSFCYFYFCSECGYVLPFC